MIKDPINNFALSMPFNDAWEKIIEFSKGYSIKEINKERSRIILNVSYTIRFFTYFTWVEAITISLKPLSNNATMINISGKVLLSPHHTFRSISLNNKKIDKDAFFNNVQIFFKEYETTLTKNTKDSNYKKKIAFWLLEISSIFIFLFIFAQIFLLHIPSDSQIVIISFILFIFFQAPLIIWLTRDCYSRNNLSNRNRNKWIAYICFAGFVGCLFYYPIFKSNSK
ncbi:hypothetical protein ACFL7M_09935 [Thermodesulfobacteriota bacterium]